jgi:D-beta-D-heptose 7-phosphate kinase/D-beta-D-heptose 1-phosphate adenosyltransferase
MPSIDGAVPVSLARRIISQFPHRRIVVMGDLMLDRFIRGRVGRISPEAPVPVVRVSQETLVPGGAGNVVHNLLALGGKVSVVGLVGADEAGVQLLSELKSRGADTGAVLTDPDRPTTQKVRVIAEHQQVVRYDREGDEPPSRNFQDRLVEQALRRLEEADALVLSDYRKGVLSPAVLPTLIAAARKAGVPVIVDPKVEHFRFYRQATCLTPNLSEAFGGMHASAKEDDASVEAMGRKIVDTLKAESLLITRGEHGMTLFERVGAGLRTTHLPTRAKEVFDVTGAGDTVVAVLSLALGSGASLRQAAALSNAAAGIVVGKLGTATASPEELAMAFSNGTKRGGSRANG